jgi:hypothetical protein
LAVALSATSKLPGVSPGTFCYWGGILLELSIFVDKSGSQSGNSRYCLVTLLFHDQSSPIADLIDAYENDLRRKCLPNLPFHASPLMNGHESYEAMDIGERKKLLSAFEGFARKLPYLYKSFVYRRSEVATSEQFIARLKKRPCHFSDRQPFVLPKLRQGKNLL